MLQLRMKTDPLFKENGYGDYHIGLSIGGLAVLTKCGKTVYTIHGYEIRKNLNSKERDFLYSIIKKFFYKDSDFTTALFLYKEMIAAKEEENEYLKKFNISVVGYGTPQKYKLSITKKIGSVDTIIMRIEMTPGKKELLYNTNLPISKEEIEKILKMEKNNRFILEHYEKIHLFTESLIKSYNKINSCSV